MIITYGYVRRGSGAGRRGGERRDVSRALNGNSRSVCRYQARAMAVASTSQAAMKQRPPIGVIAPNQRVPVRASR